MDESTYKNRFSVSGIISRYNEISANPKEIETVITTTKDHAYPIK